MKTCDFAEPGVGPRVMVRGMGDSVDENKVEDNETVILGEIYLTLK